MRRYRQNWAEVCDKRKIFVVLERIKRNVMIQANCERIADV